MSAPSNTARSRQHPGGRERALAHFAVMIVTGAALVCAACGGGSAQAGTPETTVGPTTTVFRQPGDPRTEICADHTVARIDGQLTRGHVVGKPKRVATDTATTCTYTLDEGSLRMSVYEAPSLDDALAEYKKDLEGAGAITDVPNLGTAAFSDPAGTTVTIRDNVVLTVDVSHVPKANHRSQIAQSLSFEILTTFNG